MEYFEILKLQKEPFSNSPDPDFFFKSRQHLDCLQKLEIALRLRRGLNVVIGDVGTGKTTLCRQIIRKFLSDDQVETHLILDPFFSNASNFLMHVAGMLEPGESFQGADDGVVKERIKQLLFKKGVDEKKTVVLIIDEGQKIPPFCLEILRELLNYETNEFKLLQIVIFAQKEFENTARQYTNFADRINLYHILEPLGFKDTLRMIRFRLRQSGEETRTFPIFSFFAITAIYLSTGGYPRKIVNLCHRCILTLIIQNRSRAGWFLVRSCVKRVFAPEKKRKKIYTAAAAAGILALVIISGKLIWPGTKLMPRDAVQENEVPFAASSLAGDVLVLPEKKEAPPRRAETKSEKPAGAVSEEFMKNTLDENQNSALSEMDLPVILGRTVVEKGDSLWLMIKNVYGLYNIRILKKMIRANPHINNPDNIKSGARINFPAIKADVKHSGIKCWWIKLGEKNSLDEAFKLLREYPENAPPVRLIPYMKTAGGLRFSVVAKEYFFDEAEAQSILNTVPGELAADAGIFSGWGDENTVFFADPFLS